MEKSSLSEPVLLNISKQNKEKLKKCPECKCVWERHYQTKTILRYSDFPAYGLKKEICKNCRTTD
ncbi:uncharacterized protein METZ01_LOCUS177171 [marine metagenome]|uniref:Uncharacterized protein n=1 Tax=marine metagenome TaxID=408172 RepID=A0A382CGA0_9ZZZZ